MPKGKKLSEFEQGQIVAISNEDLSHREIAKKLGRSRAPEDNYLKNPSKYNAINPRERLKCYLQEIKD